MKLRSFFTLVAITAALVLLMFGMGNRGCNPPVTDDDVSSDETPISTEFTADDLDYALVIGQSFAYLGHHLAIKNGDFHGCMVTSGFIGGFDAARQYAPEIEAEVLSPDGVLDLVGWLYDGTSCAEIRVDASPLTDPAPNIEAIVSPMLESSLALASALVNDSAPPAGHDCVRAKVAAALLMTLADQIPDILDDALVDPDLKLPIASFRVNYSGCGV